MAITHVATTTATGAGAGVLTMAVPGGTVNGDLMVMCVAKAHASNGDSPPAGWTFRNNTGFDAFHGVCYMYSRIASSEPASYDWTFFGAGEVYAGTISTFHTVHATQGDAAPVLGTESAGATVVADSITTVHDGAALFTFFCGPGAKTFSTPTGMTEVSDFANSTDVSVATDYEIIATAGATGSRTSTVTATGAGCIAITWAVRPVDPPAVLATRSFIRAQGSQRASTR